MEHTVKKSRTNRIAMRVTAFVFILVAVLRLVDVLMNRGQRNIVITAVLCAGCLTYGIILLRQTLRPQAYDITYVFGDKTFTLKLHGGEKKYNYGQIDNLGYVVPNPNLDYALVQIYIGKEQYVIPFTGTANVGKALYEMLNMKAEEAKQDETISDKEEQGKVGKAAAGTKPEQADPVRKEDRK